jgi:glutamate racemase
VSPPPATAPPVIGVFDSGFGGLTVLRALLPLVPGARYLYLGDTARLPYGSKSRETVARYAVESARFLHAQGAEYLVVACNTATALALPEIEAALPIPVTGVVQPGAAACVAAGEHVLVLATSATVHSGAYTRALRALGLEVTEMACPLLVPLVEEGWLDATPETQEVTAQVLRIYLRQARNHAPGARSLLLACTHYPLLAALIEQTLRALDYPLNIVDSADATARAVARHFPRNTECEEGGMRFFATDSTDKFSRLGSRFLGRPLGKVELVDLGG